MFRIKQGEISFRHDVLLKTRKNSRMVLFRLSKASDSSERSALGVSRALVKIFEIEDESRVEISDIKLYIQ